MSATLGAFAFPATCQAQTAAPASAACYEIDRIGPLVELSIPGSKLNTCTSDRSMRGTLAAPRVWIVVPCPAGSRAGRWSA